MSKKINDFSLITDLTDKVFLIGNKIKNGLEAFTYQALIDLIKVIFYTKAEVDSRVASNFAGTVDSLTFDPGTPVSNVIYRANAGVGIYTKFKAIKAGTITSTTGSTTLVGVGTKFLTQLSPGMPLYNNSGTLIGTVSGTPADDNHATLAANAAVAITAGTYNGPILVNPGDGQVDFMFITTTGFFKKSAAPFPIFQRTITSVNSPVPDQIGQYGVDANNQLYVAIALSGTMWRKLVRHSDVTLMYLPYFGSTVALVRQSSNSFSFTSGTSNYLIGSLTLQLENSTGSNVVWTFSAASKILCIDTKAANVPAGVYTKYQVGGASNCLVEKTAADLVDPTLVPIAGYYNNEIIGYALGEYLRTIYNNKINADNRAYGDMILEPMGANTLNIDFPATNQIRFKEKVYLIGKPNGHLLGLYSDTFPVTFTFTAGQLLVLDTSISGTIDGIATGYDKHYIDGATPCLSLIAYTAFDASKHVVMAVYYPPNANGEGGLIYGAGIIGAYLSGTLAASNAVNANNRAYGDMVFEPNGGGNLNIDFPAINQIRFKEKTYLMGKPNGHLLGLYSDTFPVTLTFTIGLGGILVLDTSIAGILNGIQTGYDKHYIDGATPCLSIITFTQFDATKHVILAVYYPQTPDGSGGIIYGAGAIGRYFAGASLKTQIAQTGVTPYRLNADKVISAALKYTGTVTNNPTLQFIIGNDFHVNVSDSYRTANVTELITYGNEAKSKIKATSGNIGQTVSEVVDFIVLNGDMTDQLVLTKAASQLEVNAVMAEVNKSTMPIFPTIGNHDLGHYANLFAERFTKADQRANFINPILTKFSSLNIQVAPYANACCLYWDDPIKKFRYFFLDCFEAPEVANGSALKYNGLSQYALSNAQLNWFAGALDFTAKSTPTQWQPVIFMHVPPRNTGVGEWMHNTRVIPRILNAYKNGLNLNEAWVDTVNGGDFTYSVSKNFTTQGPMKLPPVFSGHRHEDAILQDTEFSDQTNIVINNAWCLRDYEPQNNVNLDSGVNRMPGTVTQNSFKHIIIDKEALTVRILTFGAGVICTDEPVDLLNVLVHY